MTQPVTNSMMNFTSQSHNVWETQAWMEASGQELVQHSNGTYAIIPPSQQQTGDTVLPNYSTPVNITYTGNGQYTFTPTSGTTNKWQYDRGSNPAQNQTAFQQALPALYDSFAVNSQNLTRLSTVSVTNASFESQSVASGQYTSVAASGSGALVGWQAQSLGAGQDVGVLNPNSSMFSSVPDGSNVLYLSANSAAGSTSNVSVFQVTSTPLQANTKYVLSALVGRRKDVSCAGYDIQLLANGTVLAEDDNSFPITAGNFISTLVTYTAGAQPARRRSGNPLDRLERRGHGEPDRLRLGGPRGHFAPPRLRQRLRLEQLGHDLEQFCELGRNRAGQWRRRPLQFQCGIHQPADAHDHGRRGRPVEHRQRSAYRSAAAP